MADVKISALPAATTPLAGTEVLPIVQSNTTKKVAISDVTAGRAISASSLTLTTPLSVANGGTGLTSLTAGYIPFGAGTSAFGSDSGLFWDNTNKRLGIGTTSPGLELSVAGSIQSNAWVGRANISAPNADCAIYRAADNTLGFSTGSTERMRLDSAGNLGLDVTPSAWVTNKALQLPSGSISDNQSGILYYTQNGYFGSGGWTYSYTSAAAQYRQASGQHQWYNAPSGTAGTAISFTQAMTLDASGNLGLGATTTSGGRLVITQSNSVQPAIYFPTDETTIQGPSADTQIRLGGNIVFQGANVAGVYAKGASGYIQFNTGTSLTERMRIDASGNVVINTAAIATNATDGFLYVPTCAGTPTGTPTTYTGRAPIVVNTTNNKLYFYSGGAWRDAGP